MELQITAPPAKLNFGRDGRTTKVLLRQRWSLLRFPLSPDVIQHFGENLTRAILWYLPLIDRVCSPGSFQKDPIDEVELVPLKSPFSPV